MFNLTDDLVSCGATVLTMCQSYSVGCLIICIISKITLFLNAE